MNYKFLTKMDLAKMSLKNLDPYLILLIFYVLFFEIALKLRNYLKKNS